ncbi:DUF2851 family protein [Aureispira sp. CCB-E]|uniref:DUF2851 family protein n=1 Tax=Aureispira sp. CCB-E TaxID=3051121 RepID=UPI0028697D3F|nr:DUF2851 family protein [Aureispira sp. CCB-E]WMX16024.1 DUF2851 family protein [Aureispira sp. CCB-E]
MTTPIPFSEAFLHYIWQFKLFDFKDLKTVDGESIELIRVGRQNDHAGPDFSDARIRIGGTLWAGSVEIHKKSSDWLVHQHQKDKAYKNTILHVVYEHDQSIYRADGTTVPTLILKNKIPNQYIERYWALETNQQSIPCEQQFFEVSIHLKKMWLDRLVVERLEDKTAEIITCLEQTQYNWEVVFYQFLARNFGMKQNTSAFEALAQSLPLMVLAKHKQDLFQLEALLFGQAGFLFELNGEEVEDKYLQKLEKEYQYLAHKYELIALNASSWKFGRMRPANFPTIRLAQFAVLIHQSSHLFSKILATQHVVDCKKMFHLELNGYWDTHYRLGESSSHRKKRLGSKTIDLILINTIAPFLFVYGVYKGEDRYKKRALELLQLVKPEVNMVVAQWQNLGMKPHSAYDTQGLIQLKNKYCRAKRCLSCAIGHKILQRSSS